MGLFDSSMDMPKDGKKILTDEEDAVFDKLAKKVIQRGMAVPAIMFLESIKPANFIMSQVMVFFEPIVQTIFNFRDYDHYRTALEKRESVEILLLKIEDYDAVAHARERRIKKYMKQQKKSWKWYQRYLGFFPPKVKIPEEILNPPEPDKKETDTNSDSDQKA